MVICILPKDKSRVRFPLPAQFFSMSESGKQYWDEALKRYETKDWVNKPTIFAEQITSYLPESGKLLELAAGQGQDSRYFARLGYEVTATDLVEVGLKESERKATEEGLQINFQTLDLADPLVFSDASFDVVYSHLGLHYLDAAGTKKMFAEIHRVLKPGGILVGLLNTLDDPEIQTPAFEKLEDGYYRETAFAFNKRFFSVESARTVLEGLFEPMLVDNHGETYKDTIKTLIRVVARKV